MAVTQKPPHFKLMGELKRREKRYKQMAEILGITEATFSNKINRKKNIKGKQAAFNIDEMDTICNETGIDPEVFFER